MAGSIILAEGRIMNLIEDKVFTKEDFTITALPKGEYDNCTFVDCIFDNADISAITFTECVFERCNLSMAKVKHTALKNVEFSSCKMLGFNFNYCDPFLLEVSFDDCILHLASFYNLKLKNTRFINCDLRETDFSDADITSAIFDGSDLKQAVFQDTVMEKADFRAALNFSIDPEMNRMKGAKFSREGIAGLLDKHQIIIE